uniref:NAD(P)(+)--arginine ADP-ribosyltransferase n=1 Tax=Scleropages formosus TaxID=113540 RepID=A0A8C9VYZ6_SCLFO
NDRNTFIHTTPVLFLLKGAITCSYDCCTLCICVISKFSQKIKLNMAPNTVDYMYTSCSKKMLDEVQGILEKEKQQDEEYNKLWEGAKKLAKKDVDTTGLTPLHNMALYLYTMETKMEKSGKSFYQKFNDEVRNPVSKNFPYKSAYFLLTDAIWKLRENEMNKMNKKLECVTTYRGTTLSYETAAVGREFRFGAFTSSSMKKSEALKFGKKTCFIISTCYGANITPYSAFKTEEEVLIPPYEKFKVTDIFKKGKGDMHECDITYVVKSSGIQGNEVCSWVDKGSL